MTAALSPVAQQLSQGQQLSVSSRKEKCPPSQHTREGGHETLSRPAGLSQPDYEQYSPKSKRAPDRGAALHKKKKTKQKKKLPPSRDGKAAVVPARLFTKCER